MSSAPISGGREENFFTLLRNAIAERHLSTTGIFRHEDMEDNLKVDIAGCGDYIMYFHFCVAVQSVLSHWTHFWYGVDTRRS